MMGRWKEPLTGLGCEPEPGHWSGTEKAEPGWSGTEKAEPGPADNSQGRRAKIIMISRQVCQWEANQNRDAAAQRLVRRSGLGCEPGQANR